MNIVALISHYALPFSGQLLMIMALFSYIVAIISKKSTLFSRIACTLLVISYCLLTYAFIISEPTLKIVAEHSSPYTPLAYKIAGVWGGAAGSLHLWVCLLSAIGCFLKNNVSIRYFALHMSGFIVFQHLVHPPFETLLYTAQFQDLNPILQHHAMVIHPPILYAGYIIFSYIFFSAIGGGMPIFAYRLGLGILTLGIALGSYWAYHELGWGGFWYWDPVEVISLIPWMLYLLGFHTTAYHNIRSTISLISWPIVLLCFAVVRSGTLNSIHSFAQDPSFWTHFLILLVTTIAPSMIYYIKKQSITHKAQIPFMPIRLFAPILWAIIFVVLIVSVCLPLIMKNLVFGVEFFKATVWPLMLPLLVLMGILPVRGISLHNFLLGFIPSGAVLYCLLDHPDLSLMSRITLALCMFGLILTARHMISYSYKRLLGHAGWFGLIASCVLITDLSKDYPFEFNHRNPIKINTDISLYLRDLQETDNEQYLCYAATIDVKRNQNSHTLTPHIKYYKLTESIHSILATYTHYIHQTGIMMESLKAQTLKGVYYERPYINSLWISIFIILIAIFL